MEEMETNIGPVIDGINVGKEETRIVRSGRKGTSLRREDFFHSGNGKESVSGCDC